MTMGGVLLESICENTELQKWILGGLACLSPLMDTQSCIVPLKSGF